MAFSRVSSMPACVGVCRAARCQIGEWARKMRPIVLLRGVLLVLLVVGGPCFAQLSGDPQSLAAFAEQTGLRDVRGFVETVQTLRGSGHLPPRYVMKDEARAPGWHGGRPCNVLPRHGIGG